MVKPVYQEADASYVEERRKAYSLYVMKNRAIPTLSDGMISAARRILWTARNGHKVKSATLAGATLPIHPHASPEGTVDALAAPYGNNIPLLTGVGSFGTLLKPNKSGASRYTSVYTSAFTTDVVFRDLDIIPMMDNYDETLKEPVHFLPLVPLTLLNPHEGIAVGFATNILPRTLDSIVLAQLEYLSTGKITTQLWPAFTPIDAKTVDVETTERGTAYYFEGDFSIDSASVLTVTRLPYGMQHTKLLENIDVLLESGTALRVSDKTKNTISVTIEFKRGFVKNTPRQDLIKMLGLRVRHFENLNVLDFNAESVLNLDPATIISNFCDWRVQWYIKRYQRLHDLLQIDIQRYLDIKVAIEKDTGKVAKNVKSKTELKTFLETIGVVDLDYIADLAVYRFTKDEYAKNEQRIKQAQALLKTYADLIASEAKRRKVFIKELEEVLERYRNGTYI